MSKPTYASVTDVPCTCGYLENAAANADSPIEFDAQLNEFHFCYGPVGDELGKSRLNIYHCPFCGGAAPESKRDTLFAVVPEQEEDRIFDLLQGLKTLEEVVEQLGEPDHDLPRGRVRRVSEKQGKPSRVESFRTLIYSRISETADVRVSERVCKGIRVILFAKPLNREASG